MECLLLCFKLLAFGLQCFGLVESVVGPAVADELVGILAVHGLAVTLSVGTEGASKMDTFIKFDAQPVESLYDILFGTRHKAALIGILDTENHLSAVLAGEKVVVEGGTHTADVKRPRGGGGESYSYHLCLFS